MCSTWGGHKLTLQLFSILFGLFFSNLLLALPDYQKIVADDGLPGDEFGYSISVSGNTAVIGSPYDDNDNGTDSGAIYIYTRDVAGVWKADGKIIPNDGGHHHHFGHSVSISNGTIVVGSPGDHANGYDSGSVYIFEKDLLGTWVELAKITASDASSYDFFGISVSVDNGDVLVGAKYAEDSANISVGAAYVFTRDLNGTWVEHSKLTSDDGGGYSNFGYSVALDGNSAIIGAFGDGSAYVFSKTADGEWIQQQKLVLSEANNSYFGYSVAISEKNILIGAMLTEEGGKAYFYTQDENNNWSQIEAVSAYDGDGNDSFGYSVMLRGDTAVIGAVFSSVDQLASGAAYLYRQNSNGHWIYRGKSISDVPNHHDYFGSSVAYDSGQVFISSNRDDDSGEDSGAVYTFTLDAADNDSDEIYDVIDNCPAEANHDQLDTDLDGNGNICDSDDDNDGVLDVDDAFPLNNKEVIDTDIDGIGNNSDIDDDNDGIPDFIEVKYGLDALNAVDAEDDLDGDGYNNLQEYIYGTLLDEPAENPEKVNYAQFKLLAHGGEVGQAFGNSVAVSGNTAIVGTTNNSAYIFERENSGNWFQRKKFVPNEGYTGSLHGGNVAIDGDTALLSDKVLWADGNFRATVHVLERAEDGEWSLTYQLVADDASGKNFGRSLAINGDTAIVGADGAAYIFFRDGNGIWSQQEKLILELGDSDEINFLGRLVDISNDQVLISSVDTAYVYTRDVQGRWTLEGALDTGEFKASSNYSTISSVALHRNTVVVGFSNYGVDSHGGGLIAIYKKDSSNRWRLQDKFFGVDGGDHFGSSVAIENNIVLVGAENANVDTDSMSIGEGRLYAYSADSEGAWHYRGSTNAFYPIREKFGASIAVDNNLVIVGAPGTTYEPNAVGSSYAFTLDTSDVDVDGLYDILENCPGITNKDQLDTDRDGQGDACDLDDDNDGVEDTLDVFPLDSKETLDSDADGVGDNADAYPFDPNEHEDTDLDGIGNNADVDDDNDGMPDDYELINNLDALNAEDANTDADGDGVNNLSEYYNGTNPIVDDYPPFLIVPDNIWTTSTGLYTPVELGYAYAFDPIDGDLVAEANNTGPFAPGRNVVVWSVSDSAGNTATDEQIVDIVPLVNIAPSQSVVEGKNGSIAIYLNGAAVYYPVIIPYAVSGAATVVEDHSLTNGEVLIESGSKGTITFEVFDDSIWENSETIVVTLGNAKNAVLGNDSVHVVTINDENVTPDVTMSIEQGGRPVTTIQRDAGVVDITVHVNDPNPADNHFIEWVLDNTLESAFTNQHSNSFMLNPELLPDGLFVLKVSVTDDGVPALSKITNEVIKVITSSPLTNNVDSDGDGLSDADEGWVDSDMDRLPDFVDASNVQNVIHTRAGESLMQTDAGLKLRLGVMAFESGKNGTRISLTDVRSNDGALGEQVAIHDDAYEYPSGLFDFEVLELPKPGGVANIVIPLTSPIPTNAVYRKYFPNQGWSEFSLSGENNISSAQGRLGVCPEAGHADYIDGLHAGYHCVQLTILDAGLNDTDQRQDGVIRNTGSIAVLQVDMQEDKAPLTIDADTESRVIEEGVASNAGPTESGGGGGQVNVVLLSILFLAYAYAFRDRGYLRRPLKN